MAKRQLTDFGKTVKIALIQSDKSQNWLIEQVKRKTGLYFDDSYLGKVITGENSNPKIISAISEVLEIEQEAT